MLAMTDPTTGNDDPADLASALQNAPPWLISLVVHMSVLILLGLMYAAGSVVVESTKSTEAQLVYGEQIGDQLLEDNSMGLSTNTPDPTVDKTIFSPSDLPPVADPLAAPPLTHDFSPLGTFAGGERAIDAPIGLALSGREKGMRKALMGRYGGNATTQSAVDAALEWLKRNQRRDGLWSLAGPYADGADEDKVAATAMALLAFQGAGNTPAVNADPKRDYRPILKKAWDALLKMQNKDGQFVEPGVMSSHQLYLHAQATIALCELYGMTEDSYYRQPAERAVAFCVNSQAKEGGWRYVPRDDSDVSVTGWVVMALQSARMAKINVPEDTLARVSKFLDSMQDEYGSRYRYHSGSGTTLAITAEGLLCRQYLGWKRNDSRLIAGADYLGENLVGSSEVNVYYWYYATQVMHHMGGSHWKKWNEVMRQHLPETQVKKGAEAGSWDPGTDRWGSSGGRLYVTCLRTYMLEVYYRHLPIYGDVFQTGAPKAEE
jgi:hypothetical protein